MSASVVSLCTGYGGLDLAVLNVVTDAQIVWHAETDPAACRVLSRRFPRVRNVGDITRAPWSDLDVPVEWLTAGYPCQPYSLAGRQMGSADERDLWPHVRDAIRALRPRRALLENVAAHTRNGFDVVLADLAAVGYDARWGVVRAADAGSCHSRARLFVVARDADRERVDRRRRGLGGPTRRAEPAHADRDAADAGRARLEIGCVESDRDERATAERVHRDECAQRFGDFAPAIARWERVVGRGVPRSAEPARRGGDRLSARFVEWMMGLPAGWVTDVDGITRTDQLRMLGNGVVPQQAMLALSLLDDEYAVSA